MLEFLPSDVMHGEGNLLAHLVIVGYKVTYQQVSVLMNELILLVFMFLPHG